MSVLRLLYTSIRTYAYYYFKIDMGILKLLNCQTVYKKAPSLYLEKPMTKSERIYFISRVKPDISKKSGLQDMCNSIANSDYAFQ